MTGFPSLHSVFRLKLSGINQGAISGPVVEPVFEGSLRIFGFRHEISSTRDAASRLPTGKRKHMPVTIIKDIDCSTPLLHKLSWWDHLSGIMAHECRIDEDYDGSWMVVSVPLFDEDLVLGTNPSRWGWH